MSLAARIVGAWRDPGGSWRADWSAGAGEPRLLAYAMGASLFLMLGDIAAEEWRPLAADGAPWLARLAGQIAVGLSFVPLGLYIVAALIRLLCRAAGGTGGWRATRLAFFWSALASGPVAVAIIAAGGALGQVAAAKTFAGLAWVWLLAPMLAAAHGFGAGRVLAAFLALAAGAFLLQVAS